MIKDDFSVFLNEFKKTNDINLLFDRINNDDFIIKYVNAFLKETQENGFRIKPFNLFSNDEFILSISYKFMGFEQILPTNLNEIYFASITDNGELKYRIYSLNNDMSQEVFDKNVKLELLEENKLLHRKIIHLRPFVDLFCPMNEYEGFFLSLEYKKTSDFTWFFDLSTLSPLQYDYNNKDFKKLEAAIEMLSEIGNFESVDALVKLTNHSNHTIRWKSLNTLINLDYEKGVSCLKLMINDPHPEIRFAANTSLKMLNNTNK